MKIVKDKKLVTAAACLGAAMPEAKVEALFKDVDLDAAHDLGVTRISDVFAAYGFEYRPGNDASMSKAIRAAFSTSDLPAVLSNVAQKFALVGFGEVGDEWKLVTKAIPVANFKAIKGTRLVLGGTLQPVSKGGELKHVALSDESRDLTAATKGSIVSISREDLINDDLGVLSDIPRKFGQMAARTISKDVFGAVSTTAADFGANTTGALNVTNLGAAYALALGIKDSDGNPLGAIPNRILCSPSNIVAAKNIYLSEHLTGAGSEKGRDNTLRGILEPVTSPFLSGTAYWLYNDAFPLVEAAFLNGKTEPTVETAVANFNCLGIDMRAYFDYGVAKGETKAAVYSTGA